MENQLPVQVSNLCKFVKFASKFLRLKASVFISPPSPGYGAAGGG